MPTCIRCATPPCTGAISITMTSNSSARPVDPSNCGGSGSGYIPGAATGSTTLQVYAFGSGSDKWGGSKCKGNAQGSQSNLQKYDATSNRWIIIPSKIHKGMITGEVGSLASLGNVFFSGQSMDTQIINGITITTILGTELGAEFKIHGGGIVIDIPYLGGITIAGSPIGAISSASANVDYPTSPATVTITNEYTLNKS